MKWRNASIRLRLTLWYAGILALILLTFSVVLAALSFGSIRRQVDRSLEQSVATLQWMVHEGIDEIEEIGERNRIPYFLIRENGRLLHCTQAWQEAQLPTDVNEAPTEIWTFETPEDQHFRLRHLAWQERGRFYIVLVAQDLSLVYRNLRVFATLLCLGVPLALLATGWSGYWLAGRALAPVKRMARTLERIRADNLHERLPVDNPADELGAMAQVANRMLGSLQESFERLRHFTADASHELRTPLTAIRSVGEVGLNTNQDVHGYREVIGSMLEEVGRLVNLVESLLVLTRADRPVATEARRSIDLGDEIRSVIEFIGVLAENKKQQLCLHINDQVTASVEPQSLRQAMLNLLDNAIKYTPDEGTITVRVQRADADCGMVEISDTGPGIPKDLIDRVFERFFRVEAERSSSTGGAGLGLAIARRALEINGGRIELESEQGKGSTFRIILPTQKGGGTE